MPSGNKMGGRGPGGGPRVLRGLGLHGGLHGAVALFGLAGLFGKWVDAHPLVIVAGRVAVASAAFLVLLRWGGGRFGGGKPRSPAAEISRPDRLLLAGSGAVLAFHWFAFFHAIQLSSVALGLLSYSTAPVFVVLLEPLWFRERASYRALGWAALTLAGVLLIVPPADTASWIPWGEGLGAAHRGILWGVASGLSFAVLSLLNRDLVGRHAGIRVAFHQDAAALAFLLPWLPFVWRPLGWEDWALLAVLGLACTALAHTLFIQALKTVKARLAAITSALEPVYGVALAWWLLDEVPAGQALLGGGLILLAVLGAGLSDRTRA